MYPPLAEELLCKIGIFCCNFQSTPICNVITILSIETSCDETAAAVVKDGREPMGECLSSQVDLHKRYGGVVPELACRGHVTFIDQVVSQFWT